MSREGTHFSFSRSVGTGNNPTAAASATATDPHFAYALCENQRRAWRRTLTARALTDRDARAVAIGKSSTSTSAMTQALMFDEHEDEYLDFAPIQTAVREAFAFCTVAALVFGIIGWAIWYWAWRALGVWG